MIRLLSRCRGFSLIEFIMVIVIITIAIIPISNMFLEGVTGTADSEISEVLAALTQGKMEETRQLSFGAVANVPTTAFPSPFSAYSYEVAVSYLNPDFSSSGTPTRYKQVDVTVTHTDGAMFTLTTVMADRG